MKVREARADELVPGGVLDDLAQAFEKEGQPPGGMRSKWLFGYMVALQHVVTVLVLEDEGETVGTMGWIEGPAFFNGDREATELFFYVSPGKRASGGGQQMLEHAEGLAREHGCKRFTMVSLENEHLEQLTGFYARSGYRPYERAMWKEL